jgi:hypothetical protein
MSVRKFLAQVWHDMKHGHTAATLPPAWLFRRGSGQPDHYSCAAHGLAHPCEECAAESIAEQERASAVASLRDVLEQALIILKHGFRIEPQSHWHDLAKAAIDGVKGRGE